MSCRVDLIVLIINSVTHKQPLEISPHSTTAALYLCISIVLHLIIYVIICLFVGGMRLLFPHRHFKLSSKLSLNVS